MPASKIVAGFAIAALAAGGLAACGDDDETADGPEISAAWARTSPMNAETGAVYMTITSDEDISIVSASVESEVAGIAELHEVVPADGAMEDMGEMADGEMADGEMADGEMDMADGEMDHEGMEGEMAMTMQEVASIVVVAGETVRLEPGGLHVMLLDLPDPLETGEEFDLTLILDDDSEIVVPVTVSENAPE